METNPIKNTPPVAPAPDVNPDITLASGQKIAGTDPNYAEYAKQAVIPTSIAPVAPAPVNKDGLTMEQANDPKYWKDEKYVGAAQPTPTPTPAPTPTPTPAPTPTPTQDPSTKIAGLLQQGYDNPTNIATATGMTIDEVNNYLNSNENASYTLNLNKQNNTADQAYKEYKASMDSIVNGTFTLTDSEQAQIKSVQDMFDRMRQQQVSANQNYEGAVTTGEIRSGRQEFMNQISSGIYKQAVDDGVVKIKDIETQAVSKLNELKSLFQDKRYKAASEAYTSLQNYLKDKTAAINDLHKSSTDMLKAQQDAIKTDLENTKLLMENNKQVLDTLVPGIASLMTSDVASNQQIIQSVADQYGIDPNILYSSVQGYTTSNISSAGSTFINKVTGETINVPGSVKPIEMGVDSVGNKRYGIFDEATNSLVEINAPAGNAPVGGLNLPEYQDFIADKSPKIQTLFNGMDDTTKSNVMSLINGDVLLGDLAKGMGGAAAAQRYNALAKQIDPTYSESVNKSRVNYIKKWADPNLASNKNRVALNTALGHLAEFTQTSKDLGNHAFVPYNKVANTIKQGTGDPAQLAFLTTATALAGELASAYKSGTAPTDQETEKWYNLLSPNYSQDQMNAVANETTKLVSSKLRAVVEEYKKAMGKYPVDTINQYVLDDLDAAGINTTRIKDGIKMQTNQPTGVPASNNLDDIWK